MKAPKGFGRNYFSLSAIQAYSAGAVLQRRTARVLSHTLNVSNEHDAEEEEEEPEGLSCTPSLAVPAHAGHCNCYFRRITRNRIRQNPAQKLFVSPYRRTDSVSSPPCRFHIRISQNQTYRQGIR